MFWLAPRLLLKAVVTLIGAWLGHLLGLRIGYPTACVALGALAASLAMSALDSLRAAQLILWLSGTQEGPAPALHGFWGEVGVRIERALRLRERATSREQEQLLQFLTAIEASPNGVLLLDASEQIVWCSSVAAEHLGLDADRDLRQRITNLVRAPAFVAQLHGHQHDHPVLIPGPGGKGTLSVVLRPYGEGQHLVLTQDVTARERAEATRRDFVANVSHEIRTPLTVLSGFVETMTELPLSETERQRVLALMAQQTRRMQTLVGDLLTLARLEGSPRPQSDRWVLLQGIAATVEEEARGLSAGRHALSFDWLPGVQLAGNETELQSALANIVNNAVRYTPEGGAIRVVSAQRADGGLELRVSDTGAGIAAEHLPRLTERFYRVDSSRSRDTGGTGLGLSIVKHAIQRHGGELLITSEVGRGSCFTLVLPAARVRVAASQLLAAV